MKSPFRNVGLRMQITLALATASAGTAVVVLMGVLWIIHGIVNRADERELRSHYDALQSRLTQESRRAAAMSAVVASIPQIREAMSRDDRTTLLGYFGAGFDDLKKVYEVEQFQFHKAPATSFLRVHQPQKFGDDLSSFRKTVVETNTQGKTVLGLEGGVAGLGIRGVVPVLHAEKQVGSVEFGLSFGQQFFENFKKSRGVDSVFHLADKDSFATFGGTLGQKTFYSQGEYRDAAKGQFLLRKGELGATPVAALLGPIVDFSGKPIGAVEIVMDNSSYVSAITDAQLMATAAATVAILIACIAGLLISGSISRPILTLTEAMRKLAAGTHDIELPDCEGRNEVGRMAQAVNVFKENAIKVAGIRSEQERMKREAETEKRVAMASLADRFEASVQGVAETVSNSAGSMKSTAQSMSGTATSAKQQSLAVTHASQETSASVQTVAAAAEELSSSITEITRQVAQASQIVGRASQERERTNTRVQGLASAAQKIGEIVELINNIASQTNLLALNATIEAARAGESGRGFAVVASEVKALATQTAKATDEIGQQVSVIQQETKQAVEAIQVICATISEVSEISASIANAVSEQGAATQEIAQSVQRAAAGTDQVTNDISVVTAAVSDAGAAAEQVVSSADQVATQAEVLRREVRQFLVSIRAA
ncbi:methyl-accepting chemotaxis protein [Bradyrhizobium neotropicale]|uniref:Chemotaxis protein n=1 Tax=Bradyrhizobium neotropicale TaxID=1497615 RepID=A0A176ZFP5_9BRAD|nr:methyl-accepting chemotaxis protein [Bradyrhizobium neotropicale]OAF19297.1 chemotaxis protein [Bradyrhizobium neotropicale]